MNSSNQQQDQRPTLLEVVEEEIRKLITLSEQTSDGIASYEKQLKTLIEIREVLKNSSNSDSIIEIINQVVQYDPENTTTNDYGKSLTTNAAKYLYLLRKSTQSLENELTNNRMNKINDPALGLEVFRTYRSMIEHEGLLLNQRINWFLTTQGFLLAASGVAISAKIVFISPLFVLAISWIGRKYSYLVLNPILLSLQAVNLLKDEWNQERYGEINAPEGLTLTRQVKQLLPWQVCLDTGSYPNHTEQDAGRSNDYQSRILSILNRTKDLWSVILLVALIVLICNTINYFNPISYKKLPYLTIVPQKEDIDNFGNDLREIEPISDFIDATNQQNSLFETKICTAKSTNDDVLVIYPIGNSSVNLSEELADSSWFQVKTYLMQEGFNNSIETSQLQIRRDYLYACQSD